jgi:hypothetical protein
MLKQHPGVSLPKKKEIHFFGSAELYRRGRDWYYSHFRHLDPCKIVGEASTSYFFDRVPYWQNKSRHLEFDSSLPSIPDLVTRELPHVKILVMLRDPVRRAVSAYYFWMQHAADLSPFLGLTRISQEYPKMRIVEYGFYGRYLELWREYVPAERMHVVVFEEDVVKNPAKTVRDVYEFLGLDPGFLPSEPAAIVHRSWSWTRILFHYGVRRVSPRLARRRLLGPWLDRHDFLGKLAVRPADIEFLRAQYLPERAKLERLLGRSLDCWSYGRERLST